MEITFEEYYQLKCRVTELERKVEEQSKSAEQKSNKKIVSLAKEVDELPISRLYVHKEHEKLDVRYDALCGGGAWINFFKLALGVHTKPHDYIRKLLANGRTSLEPVMGTDLEPTKIGDLTQEQLQISIDMLNEIVPIYNHYFKKLHRGVTITEVNGIICTAPAKD